MLLQSASILLAAASAVSAQAVVGTAYGFATGVTGGGDAVAATPSSAEELAEWLSDDTARVIVIDQEYDFTGTTGTDSGCDRISCSVSGGGQYYLGDISCGSSDNTAVSSISYDTAGPSPLAVGSNKSIISSNGQGVLKGKGLSLQSDASNVIIQGIEFTNINPGIVWGGDALDFQGGNDGVWVDHCKFSLIGRQFVVSHYTGSRLTLSNNEFDGVTTTSASCNNNHYWTMMFIADGDQVTLDRNYFHDVSGRAPKLGADGVSGNFQASNNYFSNMDGHAFDAYDGAIAILEGNVFESVTTPITEQGASVSTIFNVVDDAAASSCESYIGRACAVNSVDSGSGDWPALSDTSALSSFSSLTDYLVEPIAASEVASLVSSNAGPANLGSDSTSGGTDASATTPAAVVETTAAAVVETPVAETTAAAVVETPVAQEEAPAAATTTEAAAAATETASESASGEEVQQWGQCGGSNWTGATTCAAGTSCVAYNDWYSQCVSSAERRMKRALRHRH
ncbi:hypothetical protein G7Z17_g6781 [Cylindrodendrum hubeiense]|uniref:pectin lyase n=1 Tax=Cylindrodendrum hubeiense TaxID=595255 RepID=A0A9P5H963_9HYPO|nr:hypothetical protein G7Z17_g6781 [Cylindrodendrum hubeiense]